MCLSGATLVATSIGLDPDRGSVKAKLDRLQAGVFCKGLLVSLADYNSWHDDCNVALQSGQHSYLAVMPLQSQARQLSLSLKW